MVQTACPEGLDAHSTQRTATEGLAVQRVTNPLGTSVLDRHVHIVDEGNLTALSGRPPAASLSRSLSAAGRIRLEWKGADTGSDSARLARTLGLEDLAGTCSTAALVPAITVCAGSLKLALPRTSSALPSPASVAGDLGTAGRLT